MPADGGIVFFRKAAIGLYSSGRRK